MTARTSEPNPMPLRLSGEVRRRLGHYVYLYVDPRDGSVFYVGKGHGGRLLAHLDRRRHGAVARRLRELRDKGLEPAIEVLAHDLESEAMAFRVESAAIDLLERTTLANAVRGHHRGRGRAALGEILARYATQPADIREPAILVRISRRYRYGMTDVELYDATRSAWKLGSRRDRVRLALGVHGGIVREAYRVATWLPGGMTFNTSLGGRARPQPGRHEFVGTIAEEDARRRCVGRYVGHLFRKGAQNPVAYFDPARAKA